MVINMPPLAQTGNQITSSQRRAPAVTKSAPMVLVVEDHEDTRVLYRYLLENSGCRVIEAQDGEEAISKAESTQPDIILMDTSLPRVDGLTATLRIRTLEALRTVPIIFLSGDAHPQVRDAALATGANEYLVKPVPLDELASAVQRNLKKGLQLKRRGGF